MSIDIHQSVPDLADLSGLPPVTEQRGGDPTLLRDELMHIINTAMARQPRTLQIAIGPSEVGTPCPRRLAHTLAGTPKSPTATWLPYIGTAVHEQLKEVFALDNANYHAARWLLETRVHVGNILGRPVFGHSDLYDRVTATVVDWKIVGETTLRKLKKDGPAQNYTWQGQLYGQGFVNRGLPVDAIAICYLPRGRRDHRDGYWHSEPFDPDIAVKALDRAATIAGLVDAGGSGACQLLPTADDYCDGCPWYLPAATDLSEACPGHKP